MRIGLLSDVHGNLPALEAVLEACSIRCDALWCLGDTVGYGASPNECVELIRDRCELVLAGNHDLAATGRVDFASDGMAAPATSSTTIATGILIQNAHRQVRWSVKKPPNSGPITVVTPNTAPSAPW